MFSDEANSSSSVSVFDHIFGSVFRFFYLSEILNKS
jgi:hypothetical protein